MATEVSFTETFEVYAQRNGAWTLEFMGPLHGIARRTATDLLKVPSVTGVRVIRSRESSLSGAVTEDLLMEKLKAPKSTEASVGAIHDAPGCETVGDLVSSKARYCMHCLFQEWLETHELGVMECLLTPRRLDQLLDKGSLVEKAVSRVAALQTEAGADNNKRRDELFALIDRLRRTSQTLAGHVPKENLASLADIAALVESADPSETLTLADAAIAVEMAGRPSRLAKTSAILDLLAQVENPRAISVLDRWLSDYLMDDQISAEFAGQVRFRAEVLDWIVRTAHADTFGDVPETGDQSVGARIQRHIGAGLLPQTRDALVIALDNALQREDVLADGTPSQEKTAILRLVAACCGSSGFLGGPRLAARLTHRFAEFGISGGKAGFADSMEEIVLDLPTCKEQIGYLFTLLSGSQLSQIQKEILRQIDNVLRLYGSLDVFLRELPSDLHRAQEAKLILTEIEQAGLGPKTESTWTSVVNESLQSSLSSQSGT